MTGSRGSFLGFTYNGIHSSIVGITRTSHGNANEERLIPLTKDLTIDNVGSDNSYHFGTLYTKREFVVNFCYEEMTEMQKAQITRLWKDGEIHDLIFDEYPYKVYAAKITGNSTFKELAFHHGKERTYSGEGTFVFTSFSPFARSRYEYIEDYVVELVHEWVSTQEEEVLTRDAKFTPESQIENASIAYGFVSHNKDSINGSVAMEDKHVDDWLLIERLKRSGTGASIDYSESTTDNGGIYFALDDSFFNNLGEWQASSELPSNETYGFFQNGECNIYNAGDVPMPFSLWVKMPENGEVIERLLVECEGKKIILNNITPPKKKQKKGCYLVIDIEKNAVEMYTGDGKQTGVTYNHCIENGSEFFTIPLGEHKLHITGAEPIKINFHYLYY